MAALSSELFDGSASTFTCALTFATTQQEGSGLRIPSKRTRESTTVASPTNHLAIPSLSRQFTIMALFRPTMLRTAFSASQSTCLRYATLRYSSTATSESVVLPRLQSDLKTAMRAKNKPALNVIRALQAEIINASKTAKPIENDGTFYALVQKKIKEANATIEECTAAKREDLVEKEQAHLDVLKKYAEDIPKVPEAELNSIIDQAVAGFEEAKRAYGPIMGKVMGAIKGRPHDIEYVQKKVEELVGKK